MTRCRTAARNSRNSGHPKFPSADRTFVARKQPHSRDAETEAVGVHRLRKTLGTSEIMSAPGADRQSLIDTATRQVEGLESGEN